VPRALEESTDGGIIDRGERRLDRLGAAAGRSSLRWRTSYSQICRGAQIGRWTRCHPISVAVAMVIGYWIVVDDGCERHGR
jgi:hypothetical protein